MRLKKYMQYLPKAFDEFNKSFLNKSAAENSTNKGIPSIILKITEVSL